MNNDRSAQVPHRLSDALLRLPLIEVGRDRALVRLPGVGRLVVDQNGVEQRQPDPGRVAEDFDFLTDTIGALAALLAGRISLRASVVSVDGLGVAFCGLGSTGKSTLAAGFARRGHPLVTDAVATVEIGTDGVPRVLPKGGGVLLWPDAVDHLELQLEAGVPIRAGLQVRRFGAESGIQPATAPVELAAAIFISGDPDESSALTQISGFDAVKRVQRARWHAFASTPLDLESRVFLWATQIARQALILELVTPRGLADHARVADMVSEALQGRST